VVGVTDRGRVPFAVIGVLLLVGSATVATVDAPRAPTEPATERAIEDARSATVVALRTAARRSAREAARRPVVEPANTTVGRALGERPFRSSLALRTYNSFRERAGRIAVREGDVTATVQIPPVRNESGLRAALDRTSVERAGPNGTATRTTVRNVTIVTERNGRTVERVELSPSVVVGSPVLFVHDRVGRFDRGLGRPPTKPGLARRATARLYALTWSRGYAQYGGAPVANVLANRHVALAVNHGVLAEQRAAFGRSDPDGRCWLRGAAARTFTTDAVLDVADRDRAVAEALARGAGAAACDTADEDLPSLGDDGTPGPESRIEIRPGPSADVPFATLLTDLDGVIAPVYAARVRLRTTSEPVNVAERGRRRPGADWTLRRERTTTRRTVIGGADGPGDDGRSVGEARHVLRSYHRRVVERRVTVRRWRRGGRSTTTRFVRETTYRVDLRVVGRHAISEHAPQRPIAGVHDPGAGPLDGPNLADVERRAVRRTVGDRGGPDALARRAVEGSIEERPVEIAGDPPAGLGRWLSRDLRGVRERLRNVSVAVRRGAVGTHEVHPAARLAAKLRERRGELVDAPDRYDGVAGKARVAARAAYVDRVIAALEWRAEQQTSTTDRFEDALLSERVDPSQLRAAMWSRTDAEPAARRAFHGVGGRFELAVDGAPPYLTLTDLDRGRLDAGSDHPGLAARNTNLFTAPHGDVADGVVGRLFGSESSRLRTVARTLQAADRVPPNASSEHLGENRRRLRGAVDSEVARIRRRMQDTLRREAVGEDADERREIVAAGLSSWPSTAGRALALANGSAADAVAAAAARRHPDAFSGPGSGEHLRLALRTTVHRAVEEASVPQPAVNDTATTIRRRARRAVESRARDVVEAAANETAARAVDRLEWRMGRSVARVPSGLPVTPVPTHWYATTNVWDVAVRGEYARFTVRADRGPPGAQLSYTRGGSIVRYDWDGDGSRERLGRASRVDVDVRTAVAVVVPPGGQGVGDVDGDADERSAAWNDTRT
jgi:hypothetical protein